MSAKILIYLGGFIIIIGCILYIFPNAFKWFGNLPEDFKSKGENVTGALAKSTIFLPIIDIMLSRFV